MLSTQYTAGQFESALRQAWATCLWNCPCTSFIRRISCSAVSCNKMSLCTSCSSSSHSATSEARLLGSGALSSAVTLSEVKHATEVSSNDHGARYGLSSDTRSSTLSPGYRNYRNYRNYQGTIGALSEHYRIDS